MADYERLKGIRTTISAKQGDYLYTPRASGSIFGLVKFPDLIKVVDVLPTLTGDIYDGYTFFVRVGSGKYRMYGVVGSTATERKPAIDALQEIGNVEAAQPTNGDILRWNEEEGLFVFSHELGEAESDITALELEITKIKNGTTIVKKAECDDEGDVIKNTYVGLVEVDYNDVTNTINVEARTKDGTYLGDDQITLPKATTTKDGLMAKEDKVILDGIPAELDLKADLVGGKVPSSQLPSYVDDVIEVATKADLPLVGEEGKLYVVIADETSGNNHSTYRWTGTIYAKIHDELSPLEVKTLYESNANTNEFTDAEKAKLSAFLEANQYYPSSVVEQRLADLLGLTNLQDTAIEYEAGNYVFPRGAVFPAALVSAYNWVFLRFITAGQEVRYNFFKPTEASSGNYMTVIIQKAPARYARIMRDNGNLKFDIVDDSNTVQTDLACTMKMWGVKLDGITAEEVSYDNTGSTLQSTTVQGAIDEHDREIEELKYAPIINKSYGDKINATTDFVPNANGKPLLKQVDGMQVYAPQLVTNGDFSDGTTGWVSTSGETISNENNTLKVVYSASADIRGAYQSNRYTVGQKYYTSAYFKPSSNASLFQFFEGVFTFSIMANVWTYVSNIGTAGVATARFYLQLPNGTLYIDDARTFNISTLIANKQYSPLYNTTFDLMTDAQIKIQMDSWVQLGILPNANLQAITNTKVKTIGKNLFDISTYIDGYAIFSSSGLLSTSAPEFYCSDFIKIKPNTTYVQSHAVSGSGAYNSCFYDNNKKFISSFALNVATATSPSNAYYIRVVGRKATQLPSVFQLELGSTATSYTPYKSGTLELTHTPLYRLPNGVKDIVRYDNGQYVKDKYVQEYTLVASDIQALGTGRANIDTVNVLKNNDGFIYNNGSSLLVLSETMFVNGFKPVANAATDSTDYIGTFSNYTTTLFILAFTKGKYANLEAAKTALAGTKILYQLATPLLANELVNADGQLVQENKTTIIQEQTLPSLVNMDFTVDTKAQVIANKDTIASNYTALDNAKADKVVLTNLITNGNFSNGTTGWTLEGTSTYTINDGKIRFFANGTSILPRILLSVSTVSNQKYYLRSFYNTNDTTNTKIIRTASNPYDNITSFITNPNTYGSSIFNTTKNDSSIEFFINGYTNHTPLATEYLEIGNVVLINLTATFGAGNEPTKEQMDAIMTLKGGYFSTATLNVIDVMKLFTPKTQEGWLTPTLTNATHDATNPVQYMKDTLGFVHFRGKLTRTTAGSAVITLPTGYRIGKTTVIPCISGSVSFGAIQFVGSNGEVIYLDTPSTPSLAFTLDGISYKASA